MHMMTCVGCQYIQYKIPHDIEVTGQEKGETMRRLAFVLYCHAQKPQSHAKMVLWASPNSNWSNPLSACILNFVPCIEPVPLAASLSSNTLELSSSLQPVQAFGVLGVRYCVPYQDRRYTLTTIRSKDPEVVTLSLRLEANAGPY